MIKSLLGIRLRALFAGIGRGKNGKQIGKGKIVLVALLFVYLIGVFAFLSLSSAMTLAPSLIYFGAEWIYFSIFNLVAFSLIFIFSVFETKSQLFECRDNSLLMSMPIPPRYIVISRVVSVLILNYIEAAVIFIPAIAVFAVYSGSITAIIGSILVALMIPLLATALSSFVGYLVALISAKIKKNSFVTVAISFVFVFAYVLVYDWLMGGLEAFGAGMSEQMIQELSASLSFLKGIGDASLLSPIPILIFSFVTLLAVALTYFILDRKYFDLINIGTATVKKKFDSKQIKSQYPFIALCKKEMVRFLSSATYILNGAFGIVISVVFSVVLLIKGRELFLEMEVLLASMGMLSTDILPNLALGVLVLLSSTVTVSTSALSLEGKSLWIVKTAPISTVTLIYAKLVPHLVISLPTTLLSSIAFAVAISCPPKYLPFLIIVPLVASVMFAILGLIINISFPKFDFENDAMVVKQSVASLISTLGNMTFGLLFVVGAFILSFVLDGIFVALILSSLIILLTMTLYLILSGPSRRRLEKL